MRGLAASAAALVLAWGSASASGATVSVAGAIVPPGTVTTISGTGFTPNGLVDIFLDGERVDLVTADGAGAFAGNRVRIPVDTVPGPHHLSATNHNAASGVGKTICDNTVVGCVPLWHGSVFDGTPGASYLSLADGVLYIPSNRIKAFDLPSAAS